MIPYLIGAGLGLAIGLFALVSGFDRDRSFYPVVLIVVASYYLLFAAIGGSAEALWGEIAIGLVFVALAVIGFRTTLWLAAIGLIAHGLQDLVHNGLIDNDGVPAWWPAFCMSIDVVLGAWLALRLLFAKRPSAPIGVETQE